MKFIFADSLDYIDPNYDFIHDQNAKGRRPYWDDVYPHEFMDKPPYDGILISRAVVGNHVSSGKYTEAQAMRFKREGARAFLRYSVKDFPDSALFGDCGAFQYHKLENPPYTPEEMLDFYEDGGFTHGCSVDHIIFDFDPAYDNGKAVPIENKRRRDITLENAEKFLKLSKPMLKRFKPLGVVQGWSPLSMVDATRQLVGMGYDYIALGGLVPMNAKSIHLVLQAIQQKVRPDIKIHILGFAKPNQIDEFRKYQIASFDTTSPMIRAFKDSSQNYWLAGDDNGLDYYMAIKIPQAYENTGLKNMVKMGRLKQETLVALESATLDAVRSYAHGKVHIDEALDILKQYSKIVLARPSDTEETLNKKVEKLSTGYRRTLACRPWEKCKCKVCREAGIEVLIFRASNRNKRRGIHNIGVFNAYLKRKN
jgi:hypothetical protein